MLRCHHPDRHVASLPCYCWCYFSCCYYFSIGCHSIFVDSFFFVLLFSHFAPRPSPIYSIFSDIFSSNIFFFKDKVIFRHWFRFEWREKERMSVEVENRINEISGQKYRKWISFAAPNQQKAGMGVRVASGVSKRAAKARFKLQYGHRMLVDKDQNWMSIEHKNREFGIEKWIISLCLKATLAL